MKRKLSLVVVVCFALLSFVQAECLKGNCYNGQGAYVYPSGAKYVGEFRKGKIHGQGVLYFSNGNRYVGQWANQYREGKGKLVYISGEVYTGNFRKSKFNGKGTMTFPDGSKYVGDWKDDIQHGYGVYTYSDGDRYEGYFKKGKLDGQGTMYYIDGSSYAGSWKSNYKDGQGTFTHTNGKEVTGFWLAGKFTGDESVAAESNAVVIEDELRNCNSIFCTDGIGTYTYADGSKWVGEFKEGKPEGEGTCYYINGDKYKGNWKRHAPHGEGIMYYTNGRVVGAKWTYGNPTGELESEQESIATAPVKVERTNEVKIWAVVVGVARYSHMPVLKYTDDDAYQIYAFLKSPQGGALQDDQMRILIDEDATRANVLKSMRQVFLKADENDVVVLYFSGHGLPGSFLPVDFDGFNNKVKHEDIQQIFRETKAKHKICLADACHSGTLMARRSPLDNTLKKYYEAFEKSPGGTALLLSSKGDEFSLEDHGLRQGIFSHFLIRGLKGEADKNSNDIVTVQELFDFVYTKVRTYTANAQTPAISGKYDKYMPVAVVR